ncbi:ArnT family glycosyltransferase [Kitasatospora sp. NPDC001175]|uniref:ArnT family glycosyltransferase n=1 Tax=Kitasatospora sp. NPDC001175 TaxID=3157103 RepID=UPI003CFCDA9B
MATDTLTEPRTPDPLSPHLRRAPWKSPDGQPGYARPVLLGIAGVAAVLFAWRINHSQYHGFYAGAVRSMTESWKAFFFGSFDPANTITLDKLPGFLWPQALAARLLGFHPWVLTLPQVAEGVLTVLVLFRTVRRWAGVDAGLLAAAAFSLTPVTVGLFRTSVEDPAFTLLLVLAADAAQRAALSARLRSLLLCAVWLGLAFQAKMLEAWTVLPALAAVYLLAAPVSLWRRLGHLVLAGLLALAVSVSWMAVVTAVPAGHRPFVDGSTDNSAISMVVGYNFLNRFSAVGLNAADTGSVVAVRGGPRPSATGTSPTASPSSAAGTGSAPATAPARPAGTTSAPATAPTATPTGATAAAGTSGGSQDGGWTKMFGRQFAPQTGWFYPWAALALLCGLLWRRREPRTDALRSGMVLWGTWLGLFFLVFSAGSVGRHSYYMGVVAVALAALSGAGAVLMWREFRSESRRAWALPAAITGTVLWHVFLATRFPDFLPWLATTVLSLGGLALGLLGLARLGEVADQPGQPGHPDRPAGHRLVLAGGLAAAIAAGLVAPGAWASSVLTAKHGGSSMGAVGPSDTPPAAAEQPRRRVDSSTSGNSTGRLTASQQALLGYLRAHRNGSAYLFAASSWGGASPFILATGEKVLPMGGFTGLAPSPTMPEFRRLVDTGAVRYVLLGNSLTPGSAPTGGPDGSAASQIRSWVRSSCAEVPAGEYGVGAPSTALGDSRTLDDDFATQQRLYACAPTR